VDVPPVAKPMIFEGFSVDPHERQLLVDGVPVKIGARAFHLLMALMERCGRVASKNELLEIVWPGVIVEENTLQVHISTLRKLLGPQIIATVPGRGYRFTAMPQSGEALAPEPALFPPAHERPGNLPEALPALYGRDIELKELLRLIQTQRLVTLVGASGIGKTRLAQAAAHALREQWSDGAWMVELAPVTDPLLVPAAVAQALGARLSGQEGGAAELAQRLCGKTMLLVLDNCEHLLQATAELVIKLLAQAPGVKALLTSQEPLHVADEQQFRVPSLAVPSEAQSGNARDFGALTLFEARARAVEGRFRLDEGNLAAVVEICRRVDGLPLAIELAAARVPLLGVEGVRNRLDDRFRVLTAGARTSMPRHQTLRAAIEWSYSLLGAHEQAVMRRLGVFVGSFGLESAQCVAADENIDEWAVLDHIGALVDKSLVVVEPGDEPRYRLLENGRAWAIEKLAEAGEMEATLRRHAQAMLAVFERFDTQQWTVPNSKRMQRYLPDLDNLRAALDWASSAAGDAELQIALTGPASSIFRNVGQRVDALRRCEAAIVHIGPATPPKFEARLLRAWLQLIYPRIGAREIAAGARAVELHRAQGDRPQLMAALAEYGAYLAVSGAHSQAKQAFDEADQMYEPAWPVALRLWAIRGRLWLLLRQGCVDEAYALFENGLALTRATGDTYLIARVLVAAAQACFMVGRLEDAAAYGREAVELVRRERLGGRMARFALGQLCLVLTELGELDEALALARENLQSLARAYHIVDFLNAFALLALRRGRIAEAARALGRADVQYDLLREVRRPGEERARKILLANLRKELPAVELEKLLKLGADLSDDEAARQALAN